MELLVRKTIIYKLLNRKTNGLYMWNWGISRHANRAKFSPASIYHGIIHRRAGVILLYFLAFPPFIVCRTIARRSVTLRPGNYSAARCYREIYTLRGKHTHRYGGGSQRAEAHFILSIYSYGRVSHVRTRGVTGGAADIILGREYFFTGRGAFYHFE